ncbi:TetR/AcrR family transcriptional regulator [Beggiatoa leptomitoformis]|uniref:TetR family transcriptional regulator n=1 Tax=Beggiatoa leptomitoformis TaxID=288004 RepID=A0A2N9YCL9_9GAMM|nr:TetR/AcrR family transcriptional regulator [Beggiatoa leptomitoformis]ALG66498.1 TetR family transcriptional regulator [Beggiatoa leptomitoformis]AUI68207.1 TetR family transcriptional regulator [Beggiatoa leptomitoformis]
MGRRNDHSREEIQLLAIQAAEKIVTEQGWRALSTRKVAKEIGYTVGSLYLVFENLDDLIMQVNGRTLDELYAVVADIAINQKDAETCLCALGQAYLTFATENTQRWLMIFEYSRQADPVLPTWYYPKIAQLFSLVASRLKPLLPVSNLPQLTNATHALWGSVHGICILALTEKLAVVGTNSVQELLETLIHTYLAGLRNL